MTTDVQDAQAAVIAAKNTVDEAEEDLLSGKRSISSAALHKLRDGWRHADLTAQRTRTAAEEQRRNARLEGLAAIGAEVDKLAQPEHAEQLAEAVRDIATACARFRALAESHDADVAELIGAATDLRVEPSAPDGPRGTSSYVAVVKASAIAHRRVVITPLADRASAALGHAVRGDIGRAIAYVQVASTAPEAKRPDHLLRDLSSGMLIPIYGSLNDGMQAHLRKRSGGLVELSDYDIDRYMRGELA